MTELLGLLVAAAAAFAATNVDDILLLTALFGMAASGGARLRGRHIVAGQYLGVGALVALSAVGAFGLLLVPEPVIGLLGLVPLALGVRGLLALRHDDDGDGAPRPSALAGGALGVAAITMANGADNVSVYVPFFASSGAGGMVAIVAVFAVLVAVWCVAGRLAGTHPATVRAIERWGDVAVPIVLIGLGVIILLEAFVGADVW